MNNLDTWQELYAITKQWVELKPWENIFSDDFIRIDFDDEPIYCTIMGKAGNCIGLSIYQGESGLEDLDSISSEPFDDTTMQYLMYDQTCTTFYMGNREDIPKQQKKIIKDLGLKYRGRGNWPYFISYKKRFSPYHIDDNQAELLIKVFKKLIETITIYNNKEIDVDFEDNEMIWVRKQDNNWQYEAMCIPEVNKFTPVELTNQQLLTDLKAAPKNNNNIIMDLVYMNTKIKDDRYDRPVNTLLFMVLDETSQMITYFDILEPEDDEISKTIDFMINYILQAGCPEKIFIRNPAVWSACLDICERCKIELHVTALPMIDYIIAQMLEMNF